MTAATWADHRDEIKAQVAKIRACDRSSPIRRRTLRLSVFGDANDALVAEVIRTTFGDVVVTYRRGGVRAVAPLTDDDPARTYPVDGYQPLTAAVLRNRIGNGAKRLTLLLPTQANQERMVLGHRADADPEVVARSQVARLQAAVAYRREQGHDDAQIAGTAEYLAAAEANLAAIRAERSSGRKRR
ncbi:hypothetical protein ACAG24_026285 [Mycobacterium sp. pW049]|uniref:hypothetical protein n=1 Tax=[Mycobacterium] bulgaricum TaxID=3238985 RepID=UPI00351AC015